MQGTWNTPQKENLSGGHEKYLFKCEEPVCAEGLFISCVPLRNSALEVYGRFKFNVRKSFLRIEAIQKRHIGYTGRWEIFSH